MVISLLKIPMKNFTGKNITIKKGFIIAVIALVVANLLFLSIYHKLFLSNQINNSYTSLTEQLNREVETIKNDLENNSDINTYLEDYANDTNTIVTIKDSNNSNIKEYYPSNYHKKNTSYLVTVSNIIYVNDIYYLLSLSRQKEVLTIRLLLNFLAFELIIILILTSSGILFANFKILSPITSLSKDMENYKKGIRPTKRPIHGGIDNLQNDFVDLVDNLEEEKQKQNRIIASISHDIKTPLTSILGYSERLTTSTKLNDETKARYASTIYNKSLVMKEIVEEFDDYLSLRLNQEDKKEKVIIADLVDYLNNYYKDELLEKDIVFTIKTDCPKSSVFVNFAALKRVFSNTIMNSIRYLNGSKKIIIINITKEKNDTIRFEIADNGTGTKENLQKIFEPLYTTDRSRKISGLGLSICKEIVESHNGNIKAQNNELGGFSIIFTIPLYKELLT